MGWRRGRPTAVAVSALEKLAILGVDMFSLSNPEISISADRYAADVDARNIPFRNLGPDHVCGLEAPNALGIRQVSAGEYLKGRVGAAVLPAPVGFDPARLCPFPGLPWSNGLGGCPPSLGLLPWGV